MNPKWIKKENPAYENWVRTLPCLVCGINPVDCHHVDHARRNAYMSVPLCRVCHSEYHQHERAAFEKNHKINLDWEMLKLLMTYIEDHVTP